MSDITHTFADLKRLVVKANVPVEHFLNVAEVLDERQQEINAANRASPEDRSKIDALLKALNGDIAEGMPTSEICTRADVSFNRGTSTYARNAKQRLLADLRKK